VSACIALHTAIVVRVFGRSKGFSRCASLRDGDRNFHTAFYDRSGDLQWLHPAGRVRGFWNVLALGSGADLKRLYAHYARGWMFVDIISVFPWGYVQGLLSGRGDDTTGDSGKEAKVLKVLRLLRLTKLLRLVRAMRILKKYVSTATRDATHPGLVEHFLTSSCAYGQ
jgi:hypothetical protein